MAKSKTFNLNNFVEESASTVVPQKNYTTEMPQPAPQPAPQPIAQPIAQPMQQPMQQVQPTYYVPQPIMQPMMPQPEQPQQPQRRSRGRKKSLRTIPRENGKVVFLEIETDAIVARISVLQRVDKQDIIRTALDEFLRLHYTGSDLDEEGAKLIDEYIFRTTREQ